MRKLHPERDLSPTFGMHHVDLWMTIIGSNDELLNEFQHFPIALCHLGVSSLQSNPIYRSLYWHLFGLENEHFRRRMIDIGPRPE